MKFKIVLVLSASYSNSLENGHSCITGEGTRKQAVCFNMGAFGLRVGREPHLIHCRFQA